MNRYGKRCVLYPRVSTEMQVDGYSLEGQKNMLTRFADREEMIVVDTYEDAGKSGKSIEGRPAFQKMLRDIEDGLDIDYILVYKLSRFGRNAADILNSLELVQSYGVNLICIEEGIDSSQTSGKLLISVLSAVAEIERENIIEQTMNGRREKARQGGWNGGFAPYGYTLEDNKLMIEETEAVAIRKIFELYTSSEIGLGGIANQLNLQGIRKIPRQNGTLEDWTGHFIKLILDNPVYCGKIAYGRRTKEKVKGTKNDYQMKRNDDYILTEGQHKGIVSEEVWEKAHAKRLRTGVKQPSKIGRDRVHLLSGLLKCPVCGSPMYTNKHAWTNKDGTYKEIYYYVCSRNRMVRGKHCEYKAMLKKTDIEPMVIEAIREIVRNEEYAQAIKKRIGVQIDTKAVDKELEGYQAKLKEVDLNKTRLEREIDSLPADAKYRERKLHDMTLRLDSLYDVIVELEEKIEDARLRRDAIKQQAITLENIYKIMVNFDCVYNIINDEEKRNVVTALIKEIEIYRNDESEYPLKRIGLNFPVFKDGGEVTELLWDKGNTVEAADVLTKMAPATVLGNCVAIIFGGLLNNFGKKHPETTGNGVLVNDGKTVKKTPPLKPTFASLCTGMIIAFAFYQLGAILHRFVPVIPTYAWMIIAVVLVKGTGIMSEELEDAAREWGQFAIKSWTAAALAGIGFTLIDLNTILKTLTPLYLITVVLIVGIITFTASVLGKLVGFFPLESAIAAGMCTTNMGGSGNVAVLSSAHRMELLPFAQIVTRSCGALMLTLGGILVQMVG